METCSPPKKKWNLRCYKCRKDFSTEVFDSPHCPECAGQIKKAQREALASRKVEITKYDDQLRMGIPPQYHGAAFGDAGSGNESAITAWLKAEYRGLLTFTGSAGTGKTRMLYAFERHYHVFPEPRTATETGQYYDTWYTAPALCKILQAKAGESMTEQAEFVRWLCETKGRIIIDDLGIEKMTDFTKQDISLIISEREAWGRPLIITTNLSIKEVSKRIDDRIASRISGGTILKFTGKDRRLKK